VGEKREVPVDLDTHMPDKIQVICNPSLEWHVLSVKVKPKSGPFVEAKAPTSIPGHALTYNPRRLVNWEDWIPSDPFREGGSVFINPAFGLRTGDLVVFTHKKGTQTRMVVPANFGTVAAMRASLVPAKKPETNRFTHMLDFDDDE
jgi:hypothetical protein